MAVVPAQLEQATQTAISPVLPPQPSPRYIGRMSERTKYRVSIRQIDADGRITWHGVLITEDHEKANETMDILKGDPEVRVKLEAIIPGKGYEEVIPPARKRR